MPRCSWARRILGIAFILMFFLWGEGTPYPIVAIPLCFMGVGVGLAGTPSSNSLTGSVPVRRVGMASGTADLQRDLGGALMTSIFGALLTAGYAASMGTAIAESGQDVTASTQSQLQLSYASAANLAEQNPQYSDQIISAAQSSFLEGDQLAYIAGLVAVVIGGALTFFVFPKKEDEERMRAAFHAEDQESSTEAGSDATTAPGPVTAAELRTDRQEPVPGHSLRAGSIHEQGMLIDHKHPAATTKPRESAPVRSDGRWPRLRPDRPSVLFRGGLNHGQEGKGPGHVRGSLGARAAIG